MGLGKLNVFVSQLDHGCLIDSRTWYITLYDCEGRVFTWCNKRYVAMPAPCGHLELLVPPGCYTVLATWSFAVTPGGTIVGNHFTDHAVAHVCCDCTTCVTLFTPSAHRCGILFDVALQAMEHHPEGAPPPEAVKAAREAIREVLRYTAQPAHPYELGNLEELLEVLEKGPPREAES